MTAQVPGPRSGRPRVLVVVPCRNEEASIGKVVRDFLAQPPVSEVIVVDNASSDRTAEIASAAGARVVTESRPGKGYALVTGFRAADEADLYVMVDGDDTYPAEDLPRLLEPMNNGADMVIGTRLQQVADGALPSGHGLGNWMFIALVRLLFRLKTRDILSGYRVLSRRFLENAPLVAQGFEIEAELSLQALAKGFLVRETPVAYRARPRNSVSKLRTFRDGYRILIAILTFFRDYRPLSFFGLLGCGLFVLSLVGGGLVVRGFLATGRVDRLPLAVLSAGLFNLGAIAWGCGVLLSSINRRTSELAALLSRNARQ